MKNKTPTTPPSFTLWNERELQQNDDDTLYNPCLKDWERCPKCGQCEDIFADQDGDHDRLLYRCSDCKINWTEEQWPEWSEWDFWNCPEGEEHNFPVPM